MVHRTLNPKPRRRDSRGDEAAAADRSPPEEPREYPEHLDAGLLKVAGVCVLAAVMTILDTTVVSVAQRTFIEQFSSSEAVVAWTMTGYTLALAAVIPLTGWAADRFGTKRLFMGSIVLFTAGSLLCALAHTITLLVAFRVLQGLGGGMLMPLTFTILTREAGPKRLGRLMAVLGVPMLLGPVCGPILGGWLIDSYSWPWIFLINVPIGVIAFGLAAVTFAKDQPSPSESLDVIGVLLLSPGLAMLLYGVSSLPQRASVTDAHVWVPAVVGAALIVGFSVHALTRTDHPLIDLRLFADRLVTVANTAMLFFAAAFFGASLLLPSYFQQLLHLTPLQSGLHLLPQGLGAMLTMPVAGRIVDRSGPQRIVLAGITLMCAGMGVFAYGVYTQQGYLPVLLGGLLAVGMGMGCTMMPLSGAALQTLSPHQVARGSTLINVNQRVAGSIGTAITSVILTHQVNRNGTLTAANTLQALRDNAARHGTALDPGQIPAAARRPDFMAAVMHDLSHAYTVVFAVVAGIVALAYLPAMRLPNTSAATTEDETATPAMAH